MFSDLVPELRQLTREQAERTVIRSIVERTLREPVALVVENLQWADPASLRVFSELLLPCRDRSLLLLLAGRPTAPDDSLRARARVLLGECCLDLEVGALVAGDRASHRQLGSGRALFEKVRLIIRERASGGPSRAIQSMFLSSALSADRARSGGQRGCSDAAERRRTTVLFSGWIGRWAGESSCRERSNYVAALDHGLARLRDGFPLSNRLIREIHGVLLSRGRGSDKDPGGFRRSQNWIGGSPPGTATFVPPPPTAVPACMAASAARPTSRFPRSRRPWTSSSSSESRASWPASDTNWTPNVVARAAAAEQNE